MIALGYVVVRVVENDHLTALLVVGVGLGGLWHGLRMGRKKHQGLRVVRGPGWGIAALLSKVRYGLARALWIVMSLGISALGVVAFVTA